MSSSDIEIVKITEQWHEKTLELFSTDFLKHENVAIATNQINAPMAIAEITGLAAQTLQDGISFAAIEPCSKKVVGFCINKLYNPAELQRVEQILQFVSTPEILCALDFSRRMETPDVYNHYQIDTAMEILFISTRSDYSGRGIALSLVQHSIEYARRMKTSGLSKQDLAEIKEDFRDAKPQAVYSLFSSLYTQKIGRKLNFEKINSMPYTAFSFDGHTFAEKIDSKHECATFEALRI